MVRKIGQLLLYLSLLLIGLGIYFLFAGIYWYQEADDYYILNKEDGSKDIKEEDNKELEEDNKELEDDEEPSNLPPKRDKRVVKISYKYANDLTRTYFITLNENVTMYEIDIEKDGVDLGVETFLKDSDVDADVVISGNNNVKFDSVIAINIASENEDVKTYSIKVLKRNSTVIQTDGKKINFLSDECMHRGKDCIGYLNVNNEKIKVEYKAFGTEWVIFINDNLSYKCSSIGPTIYEVEVFNDLLIASVETSDYPFSIVFFDSNGNIASEIMSKKVDFVTGISTGPFSEFPDMDLTRFDINGVKYKIKDNNKILLSGSKFIRYVWISEDNIVYEDKSMCEGNKINSEIDPNMIVSGEFELTYLGNGKFSKPVLVSSKTAKEVIKCN